MSAMGNHRCVENLAAANRPSRSVTSQVGEENSDVEDSHESTLIHRTRAQVEQI